MIILTGSKGFIGKKFLSALKKKGKEVVEVEKNDSWHWRQTFYRWKEVECIIHQGAMSSTTNTNLKQIFTFNIELYPEIEVIDFR